jgi:hypothetical protein
MNLFSLIVLCLAASYGLVHFFADVDRRIRRRRFQRSAAAAEDFSDPGYTIELDCRACGQFNRVPSHRLRDKPKCGRCKARLMPGKKLVLCRLSRLDGALDKELDAVWKDEDRLWQSLADHVAIDAKKKAEAKDPSRQVVN